MVNRKGRLEVFKQWGKGSFVEELGKDEETYKYLGSEFAGLPVYLGYGGGTSYVYDISNGSSTIILGGSGSGKTWIGNLLTYQIALLNSPEELNLHIIDTKGSKVWGKFSELPHVKSYVTDVMDSFRKIKIVLEELENRKDKLSESGYETKKSYSKEHNDMPYEVIVFDEFTSTIGELEEILTSDEYEEVESDLLKIAQEARSYGIILITLGQRNLDGGKGRNFLANSNMKIGLRSNGDTYKLAGESTLEEPQHIGEGNLYIGRERAKLNFATLGETDEEICKLVEKLKGL